MSTCRQVRRPVAPCMRAMTVKPMGSLLKRTHCSARVWISESLGGCHNERSLCGQVPKREHANVLGRFPHRFTTFTLHQVEQDDKMDTACSTNLTIHIGLRWKSQSEIDF
jgi:hypothetical protein